MALPAASYPGPEDQQTGGEVAFTPEGYAHLAALAARKGKTPGEYVRDAIGTAEWLDAALADGGSVVVRRRRGPWTVLRARR